MFWNTRFFGTALAALLAVYLLLPTFLNAKEKKEMWQSKGEKAPWYYAFLPDEELNLGLDLRGGLYLELEVDLDEALGHEMESLSSDFNRYQFKDNLAGGKATKISNRMIRVEIKRDLKDKLSQELRQSYGGEAFELRTEPAELFFKVESDFTTSRKKALTALSALPEFKGDVTSFGKEEYLVLGFASEAEKQKLLNVLDVPNLQNDFKKTTFTDVFYIEVTDAYHESLKKNIIEQAAKSVRNRIDRFGVVEATVSRQSGDRLVIELPGVKNPDKIIDVVRRTGKLEFRLVSDKIAQSQVQKLVAEKVAALKIKIPYEKSSLEQLNVALRAELPQDTEIFYLKERSRSGDFRYVPYVVENKADVTGDMIEKAQVATDRTHMPYVALEFKKVGVKKFGDVTQNNVDKQLAIILDGMIMSAPNINEPILTGEASITMGRGNPQRIRQEANDLVLILREGALPASLAVASKNVIGPSLGQESIDAGMKSIFISAIGVLIFMLIYYRVGGVVANLALILNVIFIFAILCLFQASLTLPGMAGIVLTLGMAVDANVIIFERMREEKKLGHGFLQCIDIGYSHAKRAIIDSNLTTFIAGLVLFQYGTGPIKGFATTLMIGIITTMFTAIFVTRMIYDGLADKKLIKSIGF